MTGDLPASPRDPAELGRLLDDFVTGTPGVRHALIVSSDGLPLVVTGDMPADLADPLSAMSSGLLSLAHGIADKVGQPGCEQIMLRFPAGHFLFMRIGALAGLAVSAAEGADLGAIAYRMTRLVDGVGHVLTPQVRDDLRRLTLDRDPPGNAR